MFTMEGREYEVPLLSSITLAEERLMYLYADAVIQDFVPVHPEWNDEEKDEHLKVLAGRFRNPSFKTVLAHIAVRRAHPQMAAKEIDAKVADVNALELDLAVLWGEDDRPPAKSSQKQPESETSTNEDSALTDSGRSTESSSETAEETPASTGTTGSDTSSRGAALTASVS